jgi:putative ABC transport system ATP-binding protein
MAAAAPIAVQGLRHYFGRGDLRKQILHDIDTEIPAGEIVIITGPSGSGKTTLLTIVGALRAAQEGSVRVLGEELRGARAATLEQVRKQIGFIFQQHNLLGALSARQNVALGARVTGRHDGAAQRRRAEHMLEAVGLEEHMHSRPEQLSGGQRQRVAIARALVGEPAILLADEPTASLDKASGREVVDRMQSLAREQGTTILLVTHDNRILDIADRLLHLEDGRLSTFTDAVISNTQHMMHMLAENRQKQAMDEVVAELDEAAFRHMLEEYTGESEHFLRSVRMANDEAVHGMLAQALNAFTRKLSQLMAAERASLFLVDRDNDSLWLHVSQDKAGAGHDLRISLDSGIAGAVARSGEAIRVADAYQDSRFNSDMDLTTGFKTRSILCLPVLNQQGQVFAVAQLLNRLDGGEFTDDDERRLKDFLSPLGLILETWQQLALLKAG